jgi:hypothetical protein
MTGGVDGMDQAAALAALDRVLRIEWRHDPARLGSHVALMKEYLRRAAAVAEALGLTADWPWFDAAARLTLPGVDRRRLPGRVFLDPEPQYDGPGADPLEDRVIAFNVRLNADPPAEGVYARRTCLWYIRWAAVKGHPALAPLGLPDLYEPLIVLYERGGQFRLEHAYIDLGDTMLAISFRNALALAPLPSLDAQVLDRLDEAGGVAAGRGVAAGGTP